MFNTGQICSTIVKSQNFGKTLIHGVFANVIYDDVFPRRTRGHPGNLFTQYAEIPSGIRD